MTRRVWVALLGGFLAVTLWTGSATPAQAQGPTPLMRYYYYPYYYFPHSYWPSMSPAWPNPRADINARYPAYMAYPPFREPHWRYEFWEPQHYYRGFHFWLDQI